MTHPTMHCIFALLLFNLHCNTARGEGTKDFIQDMIEGMRPLLENIYIKELDFETGPQEFGRFNGSIANTIITGMEKFTISKLDYSLFPPELKILTANMAYFDITGKYKINGLLKFPLGSEPLRVFGDGDMRIRIGNVTNSISLSFELIGGQTKVKQLQISADISTMDVKLSDFMGGGIMEDVFNDYFSVIGPVIFDHYKHGIIENMKGPIIEEIEKFFAKFDEGIWQDE